MPEGASPGACTWAEGLPQTGRADIMLPCEGAVSRPACNREAPGGHAQASCCHVRVSWEVKIVRVN